MEPPPNAPADDTGKRAGRRERGTRQTDDSIRLTNSLIHSYITDLSRRGGTKATITTYRRALYNLQDYLKPDQRIRSGTLREWRDYLRQCGYAAATINTQISTTNSLLDYCGHKGWKLEQEPVVPASEREALTRPEYIRLLQTAKQLEQERSYLLIKLCCAMGLTTVELQGITVEAVHAGQLTTVVSAGNRQERAVLIPEGLQAELLAFAEKQGFRNGLVFRGARGKPFARSGMLLEIKKVCPAAQVPEQKCTFRALRRLYQATYSDIQEKYTRMMEQEYANLLNTEQRTAGWEEPSAG